MKTASSVKPKPSVVIFVADVRKVTAFYRELAAMSVLVEDEGHTVMELDGFQLVIHKLAGEPQAPEGEVRVRRDSYVKVCLPVESITVARALAAANGGAIKSPQHEWEARGFRACDGHDPEGNVIQVRESAT
jgi:predicted enzyme related to lactoylglutathione lyase